MLKNFALPPGKTPLFVGGTGIAMEKRGADAVTRVYPVAAQAESLFIHRDGQTRTTIRLRVAAWKKVSVSAAGGRRLPGSWQRHAFEFVIQPGQNYELR